MEQTYLAIFRDAEGNQITFERFGYKRLQTVCRALYKLLDNSLYRVCIKGAESIDIYETAYSADGLEPILQLGIK